MQRSTGAPRTTGMPSAGRRDRADGVKGRNVEPREPNNTDGQGPDYGPYRGTGGLGSDYRGGFAGGAATGGSEGLTLCAWERRTEYGLLNALYLTTRDVLTGPQRFFQRMPSRVGLLQPLLYAVAIGVIASFMAWLWSLAGTSLQTLAGAAVGKMFSGPLWSFASFIASPLTVAILVFVHAALMHGMLMLLGGNQLGFEATFRVAAYGQAASLLVVLPFCGGLLGIILELAIDVMGLYSIHGTDPWRAAVAVLVPALVCASSLGAVIVLTLLGAH